MAMYNLDLLPDEDLSQDRKRREDSRECRLAVYDPVRDMIDLEPVCEVANACATWIWRTVCMCNYHDSVTSIDQFLETRQS